jgi:hypothetical protein
MYQMFVVEVETMLSNLKVPMNSLLRNLFLQLGDLLLESPDLLQHNCNRGLEDLASIKQPGCIVLLTMPASGKTLVNSSNRTLLI